MNAFKSIILMCCCLFATLLVHAQPVRVISFAVDMNAYPDPFTQVQVDGSWNGFCGTCEPLDDTDGDGIWTGNFFVQDGEHLFVFTVDGSNQEVFQPGTTCGMTIGYETYRSLSVTADSILPTYCFNSCFACGAGPDSGMVSFSVDMSQYPGSFNDVSVVGSWDEWCPDCQPLSDPDNDSVWTGTYPIPGGPHVYLFAVDSSSSVETLPLQSDCGITRFAAVDRTLYVDGDTTLFTPCWSSCYTCDQIPDSVNVTFLVDMSYQSVSPNGVHLAGTFQGWDPAATPLTDMGQGIWGITLTIHPGEIQYKYLNGNSWNFGEYVGYCGVDNGIGGFNRSFVVGENDTTISMHCYDDCYPCYFDYTFQLDMSTFPDLALVNYITIPGSMNNWCNNCFWMDDYDGDSIYTATIWLERGEHKFLFMINEQVMEMFDGTESCVVPMDSTGPPVRHFEVNAQGGIMEPVCWTSCSSCTYEVDFLVDMSTYQGSFDSVYLVGSMNGWCDTCDVLTPVGSSNLFSTTASLPKGEQYFHFSLDDGTVVESFVGGESCTQVSPWGVERYLNVGGAIKADTVCWSSCTSCELSTGIFGEVADYELSVYPNPSADIVHIKAEFDKMERTSIQLFSTSGQLVYQRSMEGHSLQVEIPVHQFPPGIYALHLRNQQGKLSRKIVVQR